MSQSKGIGPLIKNKLFAGVNPQAIKMNLLQSNFLSFKEGDIIFQYGDKSEYFYLILDGKIKLKVLNSTNSSTFSEKEKNDFFGEYELLDSIPRKSSAVANTDCVLYKLTQKELFNLISTHKSVKDTISAERSENSTNIKNSSYQIKQTGMEINDESAVTPDSEKKIELLKDKPQEETTEIEKAENDLDNTYELTTSESEETVPLDENKTQIIDDEDLSERSIFSEALNGDLAFQDEPDSDGITPVEGKQTPIIFESERIEEEQKIIESSNNEIDFKKMFFAIKKIHENVELDKTIRSIIEAIYSLYDAQIARIFLVNKVNDELWSFPFKDNTGEFKKVKIGEGLIGSCARDNEIINISDPGKDIRFNFHTDSVENILLEDMLLFPVNDKDKKVVAVVQMINSGKKGFAKQDEEILCTLSTDICIAIEKTSREQNKIEHASLNRLEKMTDFIIDDINAPLTLIKRYAIFIRKKSDFKEVQQVSEFITEQVNSVLTYSGIVSDFVNGRNSLKREILDLQITLSNILDMFAEYVESRNAKLFKKLEADTEVFLDANVFYHACFQLIKNLCDAMPEGGNIYIISQKEGNLVSIEFRNTGKGIDDEMKTKISKAFISPIDEGGAELSLAIANKIIKDHGGEIKTDQESMEGTSFIISLPIHSVFKD
jgi:hypothetical protein